MGQPESVVAIKNPEENPSQLGFQSQSPASSPTPDPDPHLKLSDPHQTAEDDNKQLHQELKQQLDLKDEDKDSNASNQEKEEENEEEEEESDGEDNKDENLKENEDVIGDEVESTNGRSNGNNSNNDRRHQYPVRPEAEDCAFYMKTGTCKFGANCRFNHPVRRKNQAAKEKNKAKEQEDATEKPSQTECKYYLRTGGCKYGKACRYNHSRTKTPVVPAKAPALPAKTQVLPILELNFLGLPIRPREKECPYYMRNGSCKYGANCRFNHPDPTTVGGTDPPLAFGNGGSASLQGSQQSTIASWSSPRALHETAPGPFVQLVFPPPHGVPSQSPEWNGYQAPVYPPERSMHPTPAYVISNPATETNIYAHQQQQMLVDEFPERPGQPDCSYFLKTGDCKFKSNCKYHHPKDRILKSPPCSLSDKGLPLRPDQNICAHYSRYGICKFGPACKFDHPVQLPSSTGSGDDQSNPASNSVPEEEARMAESGNGSEAAIQQPL